jgi:hypothetical protein
MPLSWAFAEIVCVEAKKALKGCGFSKAQNEEAVLPAAASSYAQMSKTSTSENEEQCKPREARKLRERVV